MEQELKNRQYIKFCMYGFLKNLRFFDAFFILFLVDKGISFTQIGLLYAVREISTNIFELPSGILADAFGRKTALAASFLAYICSFMLFYLFQNFWFFSVAFAFFGLGEAFRTGTHKGMIMDYLKNNGWEDRAIPYYGHTRSWSQLGSALSALIAGALIFSGGSYQIIFLYSTIPYILNLFLILSYPANLNRSTERKGKKKSAIIGTSIRSLFGVLKKPEVLSIIYSSAAHTAYLRAVKEYIQLVMINLALIIPLFMDLEGSRKNGLVVGILYFLIYLATSTASKYSYIVAGKHRNRIATLTILVGFSAGVLSGIAFQNELWVFSLLAFAGIFVIENIRKPILTGMVAEQVPNEILTSVISAQSLLRTILTSLIALIFGILADHYGIGISLLTVSGLLVLSTLLVKIRLKSD